MPFFCSSAASAQRLWFGLTAPSSCSDVLFCGATMHRAPEEVGSPCPFAERHVTNPPAAASAAERELPTLPGLRSPTSLIGASFCDFCRPTRRRSARRRRVARGDLLGEHRSWNTRTNLPCCHRHRYGVLRTGRLGAVLSAQRAGSGDVDIPFVNCSTCIHRAPNNVYDPSKSSVGPPQCHGSLCSC